MLSCKEATELILKAEEHKISVWQKIKLWRHQKICVLCKRFGYQSRSINVLVSKGLAPELDLLTEIEKKEIVSYVSTSGLARE
ncbi:MAG: hypothetical protein EAY75_10645 [Bacteroidetes bacterium]|nr:MAG: hypothetical protein EAY75_10645 [Bacteroidota bacterium]